MKLQCEACPNNGSPERFGVDPESLFVRIVSPLADMPEMVLCRNCHVGIKFRDRAFVSPDERIRAATERYRKLVELRCAICGCRLINPLLDDDPLPEVCAACFDKLPKHPEPSQ